MLRAEAPARRGRVAAATIEAREERAAGARAHERREILGREPRVAAAGEGVDDRRAERGHRARVAEEAGVPGGGVAADSPGVLVVDRAAHDAAAEGRELGGRDAIVEAPRARRARADLRPRPSGASTSRSRT